MSEPLAALDRFAYTNPAFGAVCLHWTCIGYSEARVKHKGPHYGLSPVWGMLTLAFLSADDARKYMPHDPQGKLTLLIHRHPEWRAFAADAVRLWSAPFWTALHLGVATGVLDFRDGRVHPAGEIATPRTNDDIQLREQAIAWGKLLAKEGSDPALATIFNIEVAIPEGG